MAAATLVGNKFSDHREPPTSHLHFEVSRNSGHPPRQKNAAFYASRQPPHLAAPQICIFRLPPPLTRATLARATTVQCSSSRTCEPDSNLQQCRLHLLRNAAPSCISTTSATRTTPPPRASTHHLQPSFPWQHQRSNSQSTPKDAASKTRIHLDDCNNCLNHSSCIQPPLQQHHRVGAAMLEQPPFAGAAVIVAATSLHETFPQPKCDRNPSLER
ncbi:CASP-like protein 4U1 [Vigna unguiculata]|uniref:CASP-like protein 4U1 n=1 Tax=Vigna unguiculata TaxID=3917 RepID=UPI001016CF24|nr:CASP-like protein 4U1 [Vigna unguiculata]